jgi:uncharacterized membrane protein
MTKKQFKSIQMAVAVVLGIVFSEAVVYKNFIIPVIILIVCTLALLYLRSRVSEIIADERDYAIGGKAALLTVQIYSWLAVLGMLILYALRDVNPSYEPIALTLAFSTCGLMIMYSLIFKYYNKFSLSSRKSLYLAFMIIAIFVFAVFTLRVLSGEDDWICQEGQWTKHGYPDFPAPTAECK